MNDSAILGLPIPEELWRALNQNRPYSFSHTRLNVLFGLSLESDIPLATLDSANRETKALRKIQNDPKFSALYGLNSGSPIQEFIDADKCISIGVNRDEDGLCLDYRESLEHPCVVCSLYLDNQYRWKRLSDSFSLFLERYNETEQGAAANP
jgi:hypothetical protein